MNFPVTTPTQLKAVLRALRQSRHLSQAAVGTKLGVNQKRVARIESTPAVTSFAQIARLVSALGGRLVIEDLGGSAAQPAPTQRGPAKGDW